VRIAAKLLRPESCHPAVLSDHAWQFARGRIDRHGSYQIVHDPARICRNTAGDWRAKVSEMGDGGFVRTRSSGPLALGDSGTVPT